MLPLSAPPYSLSHTQIGAFGLVGVVGALTAGLVLLDLGGQAIHVTNQSMIFSTPFGEAHSRRVAGYMLFYAVGRAETSGIAFR